MQLPILLTTIKARLSPSKQTAPEPFLRWLFVAIFADSHMITQDQSDRCLSRDDGTGSTFTDVLAYDKAPLVLFALKHIDGKQSASVDLVSGNFSINKVNICAHNQFFEPEKYPLKLVYFRETRAEMDQRTIIMDNMELKTDTVARRHYVNRYFIGWECIVNDKTKQITIAVG